MGKIMCERHQNAVVLRDSSSKRLEIRQLSECPTCHQTIRPSSPNTPPKFEDHPSPEAQYVDPNYFRMLRDNNPDLSAVATEPEQHTHMPTRRLTQPILNLPNFDDRESTENVEFVSSTPAVPDGSRIRREAFSPNYFNRFFIEERELGRGGKGVVMLVRHEIDGCRLGHFACKRVPVGDDHAWLEKVLVEVELLAKISHPNLVSYRHVWLEDVKLSRFGPEVACAFILQQYCNGGDLLQYIIGNQPKETTPEDLKARMRRKSKGQVDISKEDVSSIRYLSFEEIYALFKDITSGLTYLHSTNYIHRDLKPSNCLLHHEGSKLICLISDFGEVQREDTIRKSSGTTGTISYCAPEALRRDHTGQFGNFTVKSDIFSLGMILYFLCFGRLPYANANVIHEELEDVDTLRTEIIDWEGFHEERRERPDLPAKLYQLLKRLLALNPSDRPSAADVLHIMNNESSQEGLGRFGRGAGSPSLGLQGNRVQNIDSPMPSNTPLPTAAPGTQTYERTTTSLIYGDNEDDLKVESRTRPTSPHIHSQQNGVGLEDFSQTSRHSHQPNMSVFPPPAAHLLMAPPTTFWQQSRHMMKTTWRNNTAILWSNLESWSLMLRLLVFVGKTMSLFKPCWPYTVNMTVAVPIMVLAGLDLYLPAINQPYGYQGVEVLSDWGSVLANQWITGAFLVGLHFLIIGVSQRWDQLCIQP